MLVTDSDHLFQRAMILRDHGRTPTDTMFFNGEVGYKYKMSSMQAALGLAQIERIDELVARKREIFRWYEEELRDVKGIQMNVEPRNSKSIFWMVTVLFDPSLGITKEAAMAHLGRRGIDTRPFFHPLSSLPAYGAVADVSRARRENTVAYAIAPYGVNLPSGFNMTPELVARVAGVVRELVGTAPRTSVVAV